MEINKVESSRVQEIYIELISHCKYCEGGENEFGNPEVAKAYKFVAKELNKKLNRLIIKGQK